MLNRRRIAFPARLSAVSFLLILLTPGLALRAAGQVAILHPNGAVKVNGTDVNHSVPVFEGDKITTGTEATATIQSAGNRVTLSSDSSIVYGKHDVQVVENGAVVSTVNGMTVQMGDLTVSATPAANSEFEVRQKSSGTLVTATTGSLSVSDGNRVASLTGGNSLMHGRGSSDPFAAFGSNDKWGFDQRYGDGRDRCRDDGKGGHDGHDGWGQEGYRGGGGDGRGGDDHDCKCKYDDHHGHPESPVRPCRGDRYDDHCRCEKNPKDPKDPKGW